MIFIITIRTKQWQVLFPSAQAAQDLNSSLYGSSAIFSADSRISEVMLRRLSSLVEPIRTQLVLPRHLNARSMA